MRTAYLAAVVLSLSSCGGPPSIENVKWSIKPGSGTEYIVEVTGDPINHKEGRYAYYVDAVDELGCHNQQFVGLVSPRDDDASVSVKVHEVLHFPYKLARATGHIKYSPHEAPISDEGNQVDYQEFVIDPSVRPPAEPKKPCSSKPKTDGEAIARMPDREVIATAINTAGYLCARVTETYKHGDGIAVYCIENRNGRGKVQYLIDTSTMTVSPL